MGLLVLPAVCVAQPFAWTPGLQQAYSDLLNLKVQPARQLLTAESPKNGIRIYADDYADMLTLLYSDDDQAFARLADREEERLKQLRTLDPNSPWSRLTQAEVRLHWAFVKLKFNKEVSACWDIIRAYKLLTENQTRFPNFLPTYKSLGVLHILIGSVPEKYTWVTGGLLGLHGNVHQGLLELQRAQQEPLFRLEARLIDLLIRAYILQFTEADELKLHQLVKENPNNLLIYFFTATTLMKNGQSEQALTYLLNRPGLDRSIPSNTAYLPIPIVHNLLGDIYLQKGEFTKALMSYQQFILTYKGQNFLKDTYYKQFLCHWLTSDPSDEGRALLQRVITAGRAVTEADKAAQKFAEAFLKKGASPNQKILMRARLSSDGGFLDSALAYLKPYNETHFGPVAEKAEYNYRLGRIGQRQHKPDQAIPYFNRAIQLSDPDQLSFGATSALQLGYIYQQKRAVPQARQYFEKALSYKKHEYKNSVDNKARAGLSSLEP